jgi:hypothetical protein
MWNGAGLSSVDAANKEIVPFPEERAEEEGCYDSNRQ